MIPGIFLDTPGNAVQSKRAYALWGQLSTPYQGKFGNDFDTFQKAYIQSNNSDKSFLLYPNWLAGGNFKIKLSKSENTPVLAASQFKEKTVALGRDGNLYQVKTTKPKGRRKKYKAWRKMSSSKVLNNLALSVEQAYLTSLVMSGAVPAFNDHYEAQKLSLYPMLSEQPVFTYASMDGSQGTITTGQTPLDKLKRRAYTKKQFREDFGSSSDALYAQVTGTSPTGKIGADPGYVGYNFTGGPAYNPMAYYPGTVCRGMDNKMWTVVKKDDDTHIWIRKTLATKLMKGIPPVVQSPIWLSGFQVPTVNWAKTLIVTNQQGWAFAANPVFSQPMGMPMAMGKMPVRHGRSSAFFQQFLNDLDLKFKKGVAPTLNPAEKEELCSFLNANDYQGRQAYRQLYWSLVLEQGNVKPDNLQGIQAILNMRSPGLELIEEGERERAKLRMQGAVLTLTEKVTKKDDENIYVAQQREGGQVVYVKREDAVKRENPVPKEKQQ